MRPLVRPDLGTVRQQVAARANPAARQRTPARRYGGSGEHQELAGEAYSLARGYLIFAFGPYCSYCEIPLGASLAVEHKFPKSKNEFQETNWANFLLACPNCNSRKGSKEQDAVLFPDDAARWFHPGPGSPFRYTRASGGRVRVEGQTAEARAMVTLCGLDAGPSTEPTASDRRGLYRDAAWNEALASAERLRKMYELTEKDAGRGEALRAAMRRQVAATAVATGFWSVWVSVFWEQLHTPGWTRLLDPSGTDAEERARELARQLFVTGYPALGLVFPGTRNVFAP